MMTEQEKQEISDAVEVLMEAMDEWIADNEKLDLAIIGWQRNPAQITIMQVY